jgi:phosphatidyl-myo-inositol dimannoside synthase
VPPSVTIARRGRALLVSELFPPSVGGSAVLFHGIYSRLRDTDVDVLRPAATRRWGVTEPRALAQHLRLAWQLRRRLRDRRGIVHCARALPEGVAAMISRLCGGPPYVCWAHGEDLATALASREFTWLTKRVFGLAAAAIANSRNTAAMLASLGVPDAKIHVVYPAVDADRFHPSVDGRSIRGHYASDGDVLLLSVGRLQRRKGQDVAIETIAALRDELPHLKYVIVGDGEERARLQQLVAAHRLDDRVFFAGEVPEADLPAYYGACDIFLLPNRIDDRDVEGFGIVFLEAAASGKAVIAGNSGGVPEAVEAGITGLLVDGANRADVASAIRELATSEARRDRMGLAGRVRARRCFSWQRAAAAISDLHGRLAAER